MHVLRCLLLPSLMLFLGGCAAAPQPGSAKAAPDAIPAPAGIVVAPPAAVPPPGLRLPSSVKPIAQRVELTILPASPSFEGTTELDVDLASPTDVVWLNIRALKVKKATARIGTEEVGAELSVAPERVALHFPKSIGPGKATLLLSFSGVISDTEITGVFHQQDGGDWYAMSKFEAIDARRAWPCVDEPAAKIPWELTLRVPKELTAVSNTPIARVEEQSDGTKRVHFARTKPLPSYLVAFGVGPYDVVEARQGVSKVPMHVFAPKGRGTEAAYAVRVSPEFLDLLEAYFGIPFPYEKLDLLSTPLSGGAMENAGLISVRRSLLLAKKENETLRFQRTWANIGMHEIAHQWFGDLVTMSWWNDLWLNEAFATWMTDRTLDIWAPSWGMKVEAVQSRSDAATDDTLATARSIRQPIETNDDIVNAFDGITYQKGAAVIRMFEAYLGPDKFQQGVQDYLRAHAYGNATSADFFAAISKATGQDVAPPFATFLDQSGVPELTVQLSCDKGKTPALSMSQQRLYPLGASATTERRWQVPVCARWSTAGKLHRMCMLMTTPAATLPLEGGRCPDWVLPNAEYAGYYRLNLKGNLLESLVRRGRAALSSAETVGLLGDVNALAQAGHFPQGQGLALSTHFAAAPDRGVVEEAIELASVRNDFLAPDAATAYRAWVRQHFGVRAQALGMEGKPGESEESRLLRPRLVGFVAIEGQDPKLIAAARAFTQRWLKDATSVDPDMVATALTIAGTFGDKALHTTLVERLKTSPERATRDRLVTALAAFRDPALVKANLALVEAAPIDFRELAGLLFGAARWPANRELALEAVNAHFELFSSRLPERSAANLFFIGRAFCDAKHRAEVEADFSPRAEKTLGGKRVLSQVLESVDLCVARRAVQAPSVAAYLTHPGRRGGAGVP
jgi:cytosol alanyl aminopeptidase